MLYRFSICRKGPPPCGSGRLQAWLEGCSWATSRQCSLVFHCCGGLSAASWNSSSGNLLPNEAAGLVGWDLQKYQLHSINTPTNPSPPSLQPRQTHHRSHASQVLSYSFKPAAPIHPGAQSAQNQNSSSAKPLSPNLQGFKFGGLGFVGIVRTHKVTSYPNPSPPHVQPPPAADFSELCPIPHALAYRNIRRAISAAIMLD